VQSSSNGLFEFGAGGPAFGWTGSFWYFAHSQNSYGLQWSGSPSNNTWYNVAITRQWPSGTYPSYELFIDGVSQGVQQDSYNYQGTDPFGTFTTPYIGGGNGSSGFFLTGYMQEFRISNINRYTSGDFTPTTVPFTTDSNTLILIHGTSPIVNDV
jgi:hypothetical protein